MTLIKNIRTLEHILKYCALLEKSINRFGGNYDAFKNDWDFYASCTMSLQQIGELAKNFDDSFRDEFSGAPWNKIVALRNVLAHNYENIRKTDTWETLKRDIPVLKEYCEYCLDTLKKRVSDDELEGK